MGEDSPAEPVANGIGIAELRERPDPAVWEIVTGSPGREGHGRRRVRGIVCQPGCTTGRNMNEPDDQLGVHEELSGSDPIPDVFPGQDPNVAREWEKAEADPMGGESPSS